MRFRLLAASLILAFTAMSAHAQTLPQPGSGSSSTTVLPVRNNQNGQVEALLLLEPSPLPALPSQRIIDSAPGASRSLLFGNGLKLRAGLSIDANPGVSVLCDSTHNVITTVGSLAGHCLLANFGNDSAITNRPGVNGILQLQRSNARLSASVGTRRDVLSDAMILPGSASADQRLLNSLLGPGTTAIDQKNASLVGQISLGTQGWVSIGGTLARARLIPTAQLPGGLPAEWNTGSLSLGGGTGSFGGEITGQMIEVPGQSKRFSSLGAGVTWRTPWRAKLSVGAENLVTRGKNPFGLPDSANNSDDEGRVPYVRYQQDL